ncbi:hypothetical protein AB5I41_17340 [Sphingomonas sp. MMS24-JH45]
MKLVLGTGDAADTMTPGEAGSVALTGIGGAAVQALEFDGSMVLLKWRHLLRLQPRRLGGGLLPT